MRARLLRGIGANAFGQAVTITIQALSIPVLIHRWGDTLFGLWVMLSAAPMALSFADCGLAVATGNAMTMAVARGDHRHAGLLYGQALVAVGALVGALALVGWLVVTVVPATALPGISVLPAAEVRGTLLALMLVVLLGTASNLFCAGFRANGDYAGGVVAWDSIRLAEAVAVTGVASAGGGVEAAAAAWLGVRAFGLALLATVLTRRAPWARLGRTSREPALLRPLLRPALASLALPASFAISLQGATLAVGFMLSPGAVAVFSVTRTVTRATVQVAGLVTHALMPEMAMAAGRNDGLAMARMARFNLRAALACLLPTSLLTMVVGPAFLAFWTAGRLHADPLFVALMAGAALVHGCWLSVSNLLLAVNRQSEYAWAFLATAAATTLLILPGASRAGLTGAAAIILVGEGAMALRILVIQRKAEHGTFLTLEGAP